MPFKIHELRTPRTGDHVLSDVIGIKILIAAAIVLPGYIPPDVCEPRTIQAACTLANLLWLWRF